MMHLQKYRIGSACADCADGPDTIHFAMIQVSLGMILIKSVVTQGT